MPGKVRVKILAGRNLPVMDRGSDTTDAYVEIKLGTITCKTDVYRKSLHPQWNSDWFRFEVSWWWWCELVHKMIYVQHIHMYVIRLTMRNCKMNRYKSESWIMTPIRRMMPLEKWTSVWIHCFCQIWMPRFNQISQEKVYKICITLLGE